MYVCFVSCFHRDKSGTKIASTLLMFSVKPPCPIDATEIAEQYVMARLCGAEVTRFEHHLLICTECMENVALVEEFLQAFPEGVKHVGHSLRCA